MKKIDRNVVESRLHQKQCLYSDVNTDFQLVRHAIYLQSPDIFVKHVPELNAIPFEFA